ncbi:uncharacterized protein LOC141534337 [Cotesia typhae]|uniref:uncharacterized protein LOC141534337 n=1 Tax=Cotesia typhae TaxID=2053667 RepID=UPI003D688215
MAVVLVNTCKKVSKKNKSTRINYSPDDLANALKAVDTGVSLRKAAAVYGVPPTTLSRKKENPEISKQKTGPATVFFNTEEQKIVDWILFRAQRGLPVTKTELLDSIQQYVKMSKKETPFIDSRPSRHWYEGFRKRHPQISIRKPQHLTHSRAAVTGDDLKDWFDEQAKYLTEKKLLEILSTRIFNCDETYVSLCPPSEKVLLAKGSRSAYKVVDSDKEGFTVLFMYSANGDRAPPMIMFPYKEEVPEKIVKNCPEGWGVGLSGNGWMTSESFYEYITNIFYPWLVKQGTQFPIVLYLDNHSSHMTMPLVTFCRENGIELIGLVPNSTHIMQPLDISFFHPFKQTWKKSVPRWKNSKNVSRVKKEDFPLVLKFALDAMVQEKNAVISGFKAAGLYPFDPSAVDYDVFDKRKKSKTTVTKENVQDEAVWPDRAIFLPPFCTAFNVVR